MTKRAIVVAVAAAGLVAAGASGAEAIDSNPCVALFDDLDSTTLHTCRLALAPGTQAISVSTVAFDPGGSYVLTVFDEAGRMVHRYECVATATSTTCGDTVGSSTEGRSLASAGSPVDGPILDASQWAAIVELPSGGSVLLEPGVGLGALTLSARSIAQTSDDLPR